MTIRYPTILEFINIVSTLFNNFTESILLFYVFLVTSFSRYKKYMICPILFNKFSDILPAFTCASAIGNLWSICLGVKTFCCLLKSRIVSTILTIFSGFSFSGISLWLMKFLRLINYSLMFFTILSFLVWFSWYKFFTKNDR